MAAAANNLVAAFARHDRAQYFASFAPSATFVFYNSEKVFHSRDEYESEWEKWASTGFKVLSCASTSPAVQLVSNEVAIFTHQVRTTLHTADGEVEVGERESIVFQLLSGQWLAIHEHLSSDPNFLP